MRVGVAYGSPTEQVRDILAECARRHGLVLKEPPPLVLFEDFGDSSWSLLSISGSTAGRNPRQVASDLRFMIDKRFAEAGISIAFPQRDVHLDSPRPLQVELIRPTP